MKDRRKRNIIIGSLCALLVFMGIGYAIISQMLTIRGVSTVAGDWNIYIDSITPNASGTGVSVNESVGIDKISASFEANLYAPGDKVEYKVVVKNDGNIDAKLGAVNQHVTNDTEGIVKYSNTLENGYILRHGESYVFYVTTEIEEEKEELPVENTVRAVLELKLNFTQYTGGGSGEEEEEPKGEIIRTGDISLNNDGSVIWNYYSNGYVEIVGDGTEASSSKILIEEIGNTFFQELSSESLNYVMNLDQGDICGTLEWLTPFLSGSYKLSQLMLFDVSINNKNEYMSLFEQTCPNTYNGFMSVLDELTELGMKEINKIEIKANLTTLPNNLLNLAGDYEIIVPNSINTINYIGAIEGILDLRNTNLDNSHFNHAEVFSDFMGTIYFPNSLTTLNYYESFVYTINANLYFPESAVNIGNFLSGNSSNNNLFFYSGESSIPQQTKTNIQAMINEGEVANVYYGCDDAKASSCNKR